VQRRICRGTHLLTVFGSVFKWTRKAMRTLRHLSALRVYQLKVSKRIAGTYCRPMGRPSFLLRSLVKLVARPV